MVQVTLQEIEQVANQALVAHGANEHVATSVADAVRLAEGRGNKICGLYYLESYCVQLASGRVQGDVQPVVTSERPGAVRVDGKLGFAQPAFAAALPTVVEQTRQNGIVGLSLEHIHTATAVSWFTEQLARAGFLAIGCTNATPRVAPPGGATPLLGTNPVAMSVPGADGEVAFQFDFSTSSVALGTITRAKAAGESIPLGWAVDANGEPTTDPAAALEGSLLSTGGYKGWGFGLMVELLASALTGGRRSVDVPPLKAPQGDPHDLGLFCFVVDPSAFSDSFHGHVNALIASVAEQPGARLPGSDLTLPAAVEVEEDVWQMVQGLAN